MAGVLNHCRMPSRTPDVYVLQHSHLQRIVARTLTRALEVSLCAVVQYHDDGRVKSLAMETALQADNTAVAVALHFSMAAGLPATASAFDSATGTMSFANGERCSVELCWRQQQRQRHPAAPFPHTVTVRPSSHAGRELECISVSFGSVSDSTLAFSQKQSRWLNRCQCLVQVLRYALIYWRPDAAR